MGKDLLVEKVLFHLAGERNLAGLSETEINQGKEQPVHKVELVEFDPQGWLGITQGFQEKK